MKLLIITNNLFPCTNANSSIIYRVADVLHDRYGVEIAFLGIQTAPLDQTPSYRDYKTWYISSTYRYQREIPEGLSKAQKIFRLLRHPSCLLYRYRLLLERYPLRHEYQKMIQIILREQPDIDAVLCVSCPYDTIYAAANVVRDIPVLAYKLDPWGTHCQHKEDPRYRRDEQWADAHCSAIFVTREIYREYQSGVYQPPTDSIYPVEFPNLISPVGDQPEDFINFDDGKINCAYIGQLYTEALRGPSFLFDLFRELSNSNIVLHIIGNSETQARAYHGVLPPNVILHGRVSPQAAKACMQSADILVNLGNTVSNQMPSKLIDYLSCGKPILNVCKIPDCPTLPYLEKYPLSLNIMESSGVCPETVSRVEAFCKENARTVLPFTDVKALFPQCTPEYVGAQVYKVLKASVTEKGRD